MTTTAAFTPEAPAATDWKIKLLYDGDCPLCLREVNFLRQKDNGRGLVVFRDIAAADYRPEDNGGVDFAAAMGRIHAVLPDGTVIKNVEVFRQIYAVLGLGWVYAPTGWPILGPLVDWIYEIWARWRLAVTGRPNLRSILAEREARVQQGCGGDRCKI
ncbi:DCC1-like thiol-disulfide oxidoreductase family protein [Nodosilinea nodulosa]|uniref:DCC1-like thiol-disulfide oxidoreductase family protein n=1 Tax=Nodosilinea nodulosa TaxID=416001 RepID=UPI0003747717